MEVKREAVLPASQISTQPYPATLALAGEATPLAAAAAESAIAAKPSPAKVTPPRAAHKRSVRSAGRKAAPAFALAVGSPVRSSGSRSSGSQADREARLLAAAQRAGLVARAKEVEIIDGDEDVDGDAAMATGGEAGLDAAGLATVGFTVAAAPAAADTIVDLTTADL